MRAAEVSTRRGGHVFALDVVRILAVAMVIAVHTLSFGPARTTVLIGAFITILHSSREVFFVITAFALTYSQGRRPLRWWSFWRRRFPLVVVPYLVWSVIYFFADGKRLDPLSAAARVLAHDLLTGNARYQLYFLLVSMQIYLFFPLLRLLVAKTDGHHLALLLGAGVYEFAVTFAIHTHHVGAGPIAAWLNHPNPLLSSYLLYVIVGALGAWHLEQLTNYTERHREVVGAALGFGLVSGIGVYLAEVYLAGQGPLTASAVFQPVVVLESLTIVWALFALGLAWDAAGTPRLGLVTAGADGSFGIFLAHPLVLQGCLALGASTGALAVLRHQPVPLEVALLLVVAVPAIYVACGTLTAVARRTPLSLLLTGRAVAGRRPLPQSADVAAARTTVVEVGAKHRSAAAETTGASPAAAPVALHSRFESTEELPQIVLVDPSVNRIDLGCVDHRRLHP